MLNRHIKILTASILLLFALSVQSYAEFIFLTNGLIIEGTITGDATNYITVRTKDKKTEKINRSHIMRILYTEFKMSRVYIQKRDGEGLVAFLVDEDRTTYTFRKDLYKPEEFTIKREEVLFMAEKNPSGLKGEADTTSVRLTWLPPYDAVKKYNIYISEKKGTGYVLADSSRGKSATIKNLKSNTAYYFIVKSVDAEDYESGPSNELMIKTLNRPPDKFTILRVEKLQAGGYTFEWNEAADPDGKVSGYRVYRREVGKMELIAETKKRVYTVSAKENINKIYITAFDDLKAESGIVKVHDPYIPEMRISVNPAFLLTTGSLRDISGIGFGSTFKLEISNYFLPRLELAPEISVFYLSGKDDFTEEESAFNAMLFMPVMFNTGYAFYPLEKLAVIPFVSLGMTAVYFNYSYFDIPASAEKDIQKTEFKPAAGAGLHLRYSITDSISVNLGLDYRTFFEEEGIISYITASAGAGIKF